jgi:hypothetical protein
MAKVTRIKYLEEDPFKEAEEGGATGTDSDCWTVTRCASRA